MSGSKRRRRAAPRIRDRIVELRRVRAGDLVANPSNWRRHPEAQVRALRALLQDIGYADALLARRDGEDLVLIDGHLRRSLDHEQVVPVLVLDVTPEEADTLLATLDPLAAFAVPDPEALGSLLERVEVASQAVRDLLEGLRRDAGLPQIRPEADPEAIPEPPATPRTAPGDLWVLGDHRLLCGDATDPQAMARLMAGERAQAVFTEFGRALLKPLGAPAGRIETYIEVPFKLGDKTIRADGVITVTRGARTWQALLEAKTAAQPLLPDQMNAYLDLARELEFDAVLSVSNQFVSSSNPYPVEVDHRKLRRVSLTHWSWHSVLTEAIVQREHRGVSDPDGLADTTTPADATETPQLLLRREGSRLPRPIPSGTVMEGAATAGWRGVLPGQHAFASGASLPLPTRGGTIGVGATGRANYPDRTPRRRPPWI